MFITLIACSFKIVFVTDRFELILALTGEIVIVGSMLQIMLHKKEEA